MRIEFTPEEEARIKELKKRDHSDIQNITMTFKCSDIAKAQVFMESLVNNQYEWFYRIGLTPIELCRNYMNPDDPGIERLQTFWKA